LKITVAAIALEEKTDDRPAALEPHQRRSLEVGSGTVERLLEGRGLREHEDASDTDETPSRMKW
jgi:hypothetical protein